MKIFLSSIEITRAVPRMLVEEGVKMKYNLMSYYYMRNNRELAEFIRDNSEEILIDSGAFSFRGGDKVKFAKYVSEYAEWIKEFDRPNVLGFIEMDIDNVIGYDNVLKFRKVLESVSDKIIPVWHPELGIEEYRKMCHEYSIVAIPCREVVKEEQYLSMIKYAHENNCKVHGLAMTKTRVLDKVPFDFVDSASWSRETVYGRVHGNSKGRKPTKESSAKSLPEMKVINYKAAMKMQEKYYMKWRKICKD